MCCFPSQAGWITVYFVKSDNLQSGDEISLIKVLQLALSDTHAFLLNEYFIELNTANFNILNKLFELNFVEN